MTAGRTFGPPFKETNGQFKVFNILTGNAIGGGAQEAAEDQGKNATEDEGKVLVLKTVGKKGIHGH